MALLRYKPDQGFYTRTLSFYWFAILATALAAWIWLRLDIMPDDTKLLWQGGTALAMALVFLPLLWYVINKPRIADFMIATELEMRKVNWPSRREIIGSTIVVIAGTLIFAVLLFLIDLIFGTIFRSIGILQAS